ncbi:MAG: hypothetical protein EPO11_08290 [Gammaproteobacteria bacterium]|nr:MAG: hypothetical protein EPO11_08290 [Gammaproteobacteria bacterium]
MPLVTLEIKKVLKTEFENLLKKADTKIIITYGADDLYNNPESIKAYFKNNLAIDLDKYQNSVYIAKPMVYENSPLQSQTLFCSKKRKIEELISNDSLVQVDKQIKKYENLIQKDEKKIAKITKDMTALQEEYQDSLQLSAKLSKLTEIENQHNTNLQDYCKFLEREVDIIKSLNRYKNNNIPLESLPESYKLLFNPDETSAQIKHYEELLKEMLQQDKLLMEVLDRDQQEIELIKNQITALTRFQHHSPPPEVLSEWIMEHQMKLEDTERKHENHKQRHAELQHKKKYINDILKSREANNNNNSKKWRNG